MEILCPECMTPLVTSDGRMAVCPAHGATFEILFSRYPIAAPATVATAGSVTPMGTTHMTNSTMPTGNGPPPIPLAPSTLMPGDSTDAQAARLAEAVGAPAPPTAMCVKHHNSPAVAYCHSCRAPICATCDFAFPGGVHLCPACATNPKPQVSAKRKGLINWSIGLASWSVVILVAMFLMITSAQNRRDAEGMGMVAQFLSFFPAIVGLALGVGSFDRRLKTPGIVWIGVIGNGLVVVAWLLLVIVGLTMRG